MTGRALRIGFIGGGMVSDMHAAAIGRSSAAQIVGVYDADAAIAARRSGEWSCRGFPTLPDMLADKTVDAIFVLSPTRLHVEHARAALQAGKHVLVEKPVGTNLHELNQLVEAAEGSGLVCMPGHNYAYIPEFQRIRRLNSEGLLGDLRLVAAIFAIAHDEEVAAHYDGVVRLVLPHHAYLAYGLLGLPASVTAGSTHPAWATLEREDQAWIILDYPPHCSAILFASLGVDDVSADPWSFILKAVGTRGSASGTWRSAIFQRSIGSMSTGFGPYEEAYDHELAAFVAAVDGDATAIVSTLSDAVGVERILRAAETAIAERRTVDIA